MGWNGTECRGQSKSHRDVWRFVIDTCRMERQKSSDVDEESITGESIFTEDMPRRENSHIAH